MQRTEHEQQAYDLGVEHAKNAASWVTDGNTDPAQYRRILDAMEVGEDVDYMLPACPNLSGEWADDLTPLRLATHILGDDVDPDPVIDDLCAAYEEGVDETFMPECERILRQAVLIHEV